MDNIIELAREIGRQIQKEEVYKSLQESKKKTDNDEHLQELIKEFNLKRLAITQEAQKEDRNEDKLDLLNNEIKDYYTKIMSNENMIEYNVAQSKMSELLKRVTTIISKCVDGEDPDTADIDEGCSGSCSTCGGCS